MILCDALSYAGRQNCDIIIDIATLTGACMVALGRYMAGLMSSDEKLIKQLQAAAKDSGEKLWHMPSGPEYLEEVNSKIADLKIIGSKWGRACTGAAFLGQYVAEAKWAQEVIKATKVTQAEQRRDVAELEKDAATFEKAKLILEGQDPGIFSGRRFQ